MQLNLQSVKGLRNIKQPDKQFLKVHANVFYFHY